MLKLDARACGLSKVLIVLVMRTFKYHTTVNVLNVVNLRYFFIVAMSSYHDCPTVQLDVNFVYV